MGQEQSEGVIGDHGSRFAQRHLEAEGFGTGAQHGDGLGVRIGIDHEAIAAITVHAMEECHRLGGRRRFVEHRGVGDVHAGEVAHHRLEREQHLESPLRDLRLIRRVRRVPGRILEHVASQYRRCHRSVPSGADERMTHDVPLGEITQGAQDRGLIAGGGQVEHRVPDRRGHDGFEQGVERVDTEVIEHGTNLGVVRPDVATHETISGGQLVEGSRRHGVVPLVMARAKGMEPRSVAGPESFHPNRTASGEALTYRTDLPRR